MRSILPMVTLLLAAPAAFADESEAQPAADAPQPAADAPQAAPADAVEPTTDEARAAKAARKERFELHRGLGYVSESLMLGSLLFFALDDHQRFGPGAGARSYLVPEIALGTTAEVAMIVNYLLAATAPPRPGGTTLKNILHQSLMYASAAANIARIAIAIALSGASSSTGNEGLVLARRVAAIASPVFYAAAATIQLF